MTKSIKRILIGLIISISIFNANAFAYDDIPSRSPYFYAIEYLRRNDVFAETRLFRPDILISKAEFIKYLVKLNSPDFVPAEHIQLPFEDTYDTAWYAPYFQEALRVGILSGRETKIEPYKKLTIHEALELLFHSRSIPIPRRWVGRIPYTDVELNERVQALIMRSIELGVVEPDRPDYFGLYKRVTRAKAAHMIYKMDLVDLRTSPSYSQSTQFLEPRLQKIVNSWELITSNFVDPDKISEREMSDNAIRALVETLEDPYSAYMGEEESETFNDEFDGEIEGIGAFVAIDENEEIVIVAPIKDSPAFNAGIKAGDIIRKVDDFITEGATLYEVVNRIKGPKGTKVKLTLERNGRTLVIEVVRDVVTIKALEYEVIGKGDIMHIKLLNFNQNATKEFREVVEIVTQNPNIKGVILDVRDNPGGLLNVAIEILNFLLPNNSTAVHIKYNFFNFTQHTSGQGELQNYPMVAIVNKGSASASEIVAGALKEYDIATLVGETTFGKGTVQEINYFGDNSSLKITVAEWLTPDMNDIESNGITPDVAVSAGPEGTDYLLDRAVQELNRLIR